MGILQKIQIRKSDKQGRAILVLQALTDLINQTVGDALSDLLLVEAILQYNQMSFEEWDSSYTDLPSKQEKVKVANRFLFQPIKADTELQEPASLQEKINLIVKKYKNGRCFVRPSGTEDIVRIYCEASTIEETESLSNTIAGLVFDEFGGVGKRPEHFKSDY